MNKKNKYGKLITIMIILSLTIIVFSSTVAATSKIYGNLKSVKSTGNGPDSEGRREYLVTLESKDGQIMKFKLWMYYNEYLELKNKIGRWITIGYRMDPNDNNKHIFIYVEFGEQTLYFNIRKLDSIFNNYYSFCQSYIREGIW